MGVSKRHTHVRLELRRIRSSFAQSRSSPISWQRKLTSRLLLHNHTDCCIAHDIRNCIVRVRDSFHWSESGSLSGCAMGNI